MTRSREAAFTDSEIYAASRTQRRKTLHTGELYLNSPVISRQS